MLAKLQHCDAGGCCCGYVWRVAPLLPHSCQGHSDCCQAVPQAKRCLLGRSLRWCRAVPRWEEPPITSAGPGAQRLPLPAGACHMPC